MIYDPLRVPNAEFESLYDSSVAAIGASTGYVLNRILPGGS